MTLASCHTLVEYIKFLGCEITISDLSSLFWHFMTKNKKKTNEMMTWT